MKKILLSQGEFTIVDDCDYDYLMQWDWYCNGGYAKRGYPLVCMHRVVLQRMGFRNFTKSDHINRDKLDNRRCNLRPVTYSQNNCNRAKSKNNASGYKGVYWHKLVKKWCAQIRVNEKQLHIEYYNDKLKAARAYNKMALKYRGNFAVPNKV